MANDLNKVILVGRLTREVEMVNNGSIAKFSIATNEKYKNKDGEMVENVSYIDVTAFGKFAEMLGKWLKKGQQVIVEGKLNQDRWEQDGQNRSKVNVICNNIQFIGGKNENNNSGQSTPAPQQSQGSSNSANNNPFSDEDIPF